MEISALDEKTRVLLESSVLFPDKEHIVKALLVNSVKAHADYIEVVVCEGNLEIRDNGIGFGSDILGCLTDNCSLSKLKRVSNVLIVSKSSGGKCFKCLLNSGAFKESSSMLKNGAVVRVRDVFHNIPARNLVLDTAKLIAMIDCIMSSCYWIELKVIKDSTELANYPKTNSFKRRTKFLFGGRKLQYVSFIGEYIQIQGYITRELSTHRKSQYILYKHEPIINQDISNRVNDISYKMLRILSNDIKPSHKYPCFSLNIEVPENSCTMEYPNVLLFKHNLEVLRELTIMLNEQLFNGPIGNEICAPYLTQTSKKRVKSQWTSPQTFSLFEDIDDRTLIECLFQSPKPIQPVLPPVQTASKLNIDSNAILNPIELTPMLPACLREFSHKPKSLTINKSSKLLFQSEVFQIKTFKFKKVIGQVDSKFIICTIISEGQEILAALDQHASDERIHLEALQSTLMGDLSSKPTHTTSPITQLDSQTLTSETERLNKWGFEFSINSSTLIITALPELHKKLLTEEDLFTTASSKDVIPHPFLSILKYRACRASVKFGDFLSIENCEKICKSLELCALPLQCAHGRPTLYPLIKLTMNVE